MTTATPDPAARWKRFLAELKRRDVFRVAAAYGAIGFAVIEASQAVFPHVGLPDGAQTLVVWLVLGGFPVALVLAWTFEAVRGGVRRTPPASAETLDAIVAQPAIRRWPIGLAGVGGGALLVAAAWFALGDLEQVPARIGLGGEIVPGLATADEEADPGVAVFPFRAVGPDVGYLAEGIVDLLSYSVDGLPGLRKIDPQSVLSTWNRTAERDGADDDAATIAADRLGASFAITGSAVQTEEGGPIRLTAQVREVRSGEARGSVVVDGVPDSLPQLVDELAIELVRQNLIPVDGAVGPTNLGQVTTRSLHALRAYLTGEADYRRGRYSDAIGHFQRAIEVDTTFARAMYRLANAYGWEEEYALSRRYMEVARSQAHRASTRDSMLIDAPGADWAIGQIEHYRRFTSRYPDDADGWTGLGEALFHRHGGTFLPPSSYRRAFEVAVDLAPHYEEPYFHLIEDAFAHRDSARIQNLVVRYDAIDPTGSPCPAFGILVDLKWGDDTTEASARARMGELGPDLPDCAWTTSAFSRVWTEREEEENLRDLRPEHSDSHSRMALWRILQRRAYRGEMAALRPTFEAASANPDLEAIAGAHRLMLYLASLTDSVGLGRATDELLTSSMPWTGLVLNQFWLGALYASQERWHEVSAAASDIDSLAVVDFAADTSRIAIMQAFGRALNRFAEILRDENASLVALEAALAEIPLASWHANFPSYHVRYTLGKVLLSRGRYHDAERYFLSIDPYGHVHFVPAQFYLGQVYEALGRPDEARERYRIFVEWWETADSHLQPWRTEALDALRRLAPDS